MVGGFSLKGSEHSLRGGEWVFCEGSEFCLLVVSLL